MAYEGDINPSDVLDVKFCTTAAATGAPTTLAGTPAISVYKDNSTTESTAGVTLTVDFDSRTGMNNVRVDTSADGTFYGAGSNFQIVITTGTVGGTSAVGYVVGSFSIQKRSPLRPATAGNTLAVDGSGRVDVGKALGTAVTLDANNVLNVSAKYVGGTLQTARDIGLSVLVAIGTATGQLDVTAGVIKANLTQILGTALTETAGQLAAAFKQFFNIASPTSTMNVITSVTTTTTATTATNLTNAPTAGDFTAAMKTSLNAATPAVTVSDKTGFSLSAAGIQAIWDALTSALTTVGSIGKLLVTQLDAAISTRTKPADTQARVALVDVLTTYTGNTPQTGDNFPRLGAPASGSVSADIAAVKADTAAIKAKTDNLPAAPAAVSNIPTTAQITNAIWDEPIAGHLTAGTTGKTLSLAGSGGVDPTVLADAVLGRDLGSVSAPASRSLVNAARALRNNVYISGGLMHVCKENDIDDAWTAAVTFDSSGQPISGVDPT